MSLRLAVALSLTLLLGACSIDVAPPAAPEATAPIAKDSGLFGVVEVDVGGLPAATAADVLITGPNGFERRLTTSATLSGIPFGRYRVTSGSISTADGDWVPDEASKEILVSAASTVHAVRLVYRLVLRRSQIVVLVSGLPGSTPANITLFGPGGVTKSVTTSDTIETSATGDWTLVAQPVTVGGYTYGVSASSQTGTLRSRDASLRFSAPYSLTTGALAVSVSGLPAGTDGSISVTGPAGFTRDLTGTTTLTGLTSGSYTVTSSAVTIAGTTYQPSPASLLVEVSATMIAAAAPVAYSAVAAPPGTLTLGVTGVPSGASASVVITGPNSFSRAVTQTGSLPGLVAGGYTVIAQRIRTSLGTYDPSPSSQSLTVPVGGTVAGTVNYSALPAVTRVVLTGLPTGVAGAVTVTAPGASPVAVTSSTWLSGVGGTWTLNAAAIRSGGFSYAPTPTSADAAALAGDTVQFPVSYALSTGAIAVSVAGVPAGSSAQVTVTGPNGYSRAVTATETLLDLISGSYTIAAAAITVAGVSYQPSPATRTVTVSASLVAQAAPVSYASQIGGIAVTMAGLPAGATGDVLVTGPNGYSQVVTQSATLNALPVGNYSLSVRTVRTALGSYSGTLSASTLTVAANGTAASTATYGALPAVVIIPVDGVPGGANAALTLTSPSNAITTPTSSTTLSAATAGRWRLAAATISSGGFSYAPSPASYDQTVLAGDTLRLPVTYTLSTGAIAVAVSGLPNATNGSVMVTGPNSYSRAVTATTTITNLSPGSYSVAAAPVSAAGISYTPTPTSRTVTVTASLVAQAAAVAYTGQFGRLAISATGLPGGAVPAYTLSGTSSRSISGTGTTDSLPSGSYTVSAASVVSGGSAYVPTPSSNAVSIATGATATTSFSYATSGGGGGVNVSITGAYLTQAVQRMDGSVALVSGREALLRVFVTASAANSFAPSIRVRLFSGSTLYQTLTIPAPAAGVPLSVNEGSLAGSWNTVVAAGDVRANMQVVADIAPSTPIVDADVADNTWPATGFRTFDVRTVPPISVRFVPVRNSIDGLTGNVTLANADALTAELRRLHPIGQVNVSVRSTFTSSATGGMQSSDANGAWNTILSEMETLRTIEGGGLTHYVGMVSTTYGSGLAGLAYVGGRASVNWDKSSAASVIAHELGHNFGRSHTPGCGATATDATYPDGAGRTDAWGWNGTALQNPATTYDLMSYCSPAWVSAYGWGRVMTSRARFGFVAAAQVAGSPSLWAKQASIIIWGTVQRGTATINPAMVVATTPSIPVEGRGTYRMDILDSVGRVMRSIRFDALQTDHQGDFEGFSMALPLSWLNADVAELRLSRGARVIASRKRAADAPSSASAGREGAGTPIAIQRRGRRLGLTWDHASWPLVLVQDEASGEVLGLLRDGNEEIERQSSRPIVLTMSNGLRSVRMRREPL